MNRVLKGKKAQALILAYLVITFLVILCLPLFQKILSENTAQRKLALEKEAFYFAEGAIEEGINQFINAIANFQITPGVPRYPPSGVLTANFAVSAQFPSGAQVQWFIAEAEQNQRIATDPDGTSVIVKAYKVNATCIHPKDATVSVALHQVIILRLVYTFQHAVFYADDLEILPGPNMDFSGRIHGNKDIYLDSDGNTLTLDSEYVHSAGSIFNRSKDGRSLNGDVKIKKAGTGSFVEMDGLDSEDAQWLTESQDRWKGTVKSSVHGVTRLATPVVGSIQPDGYYASQANVVIENGEIRQGGQLLIEGTDIPSGTIVTDTDCYNQREAKFIRMTNVDLKKLAGYASGDAEGHPSFTSHLPTNGLMYATRNDSPGSQEPGVRLLNGTQIYRTGGLTVVTNDPVYIQGDYNTLNKKPSAVICDSVNLLSNNWNDASSQGALSGRTANATTVNLAFIAGVDNTTSGHYNGGLENYPRLHENWTNKQLSLRGSFVELWNSQIAQGLWAYGGSRYTAPQRNWDYDTDLNVNNMPPFTPWAVEAQRGAWWKG